MCQYPFRARTLPEAEEAGVSGCGVVPCGVQAAQHGVFRPNQHAVGEVACILI